MCRKITYFKRYFVCFKVLQLLRFGAFIKKNTVRYTPE
mgnify:CR=1 FL=1